MLQQTTAAAVGPYFDALVSGWPTVSALAAADRDDVMKAWAGLGYYARARNLHACARIVSSEHDGRFPVTVAGLKALPGIGDYTAAAIAAIAFDEPAPVIDGNIERVIARYGAIKTPLPAAKKIIRAIQAEMTPTARAGDYAQAMMDLGATICTPKRPACGFCPIGSGCRARASGCQEDYPVKAAKAERPTRYGAAFIAVRPDGAVLLRRRADDGLLGGMSEVPGTEWSSRFNGVAALAEIPIQAEWERLRGTVIHVFTHFRLELAIYRALVPRRTKAPPGAWWADAAKLPGEALPSVMKKAIEMALPGSTRRVPTRRRAA